MAQNTTNTDAFVEAQQYSKFILENLPDQTLPESFYRDVSDFSSGTTLNIKSVGSATLQDLAEDVAPTYNAIDTGNVQLTISNFKGDAWYVSDVLREDGAQVEQLHAMRAQESVRAIAEEKETAFFVAANAAQTNADENVINGRPHRWVAGGAAATNRLMTLDDFIAMKLSFDKANAPQAGRIAVVDPIVEATMNSFTNLVNVSNNPWFEGIVETGFAKNHKFIKNVYGFDVYTSNFLPTATAAEDLQGASTYGLASDDVEISDVANIFMCVLDDGCKPMMSAVRRAPKVEGWREHELEQDRFKASHRYGFGAQRVDTLGIIWTDEATY